MIEIQGNFIFVDMSIFRIRNILTYSIYHLVTIFTLGSLLLNYGKYLQGVFFSFDVLPFSSNFSDLFLIYRTCLSKVF